MAELPPLNARFCVPRLPDRPQNPVMDTLKLLDDLKAPPVQSALLNRREIADCNTNRPVFGPSRADDTAGLWQEIRDKDFLHQV